MNHEFHYVLRRPASGRRPGHHRSVAPGSGFEFREHVPLLADPDPRRLDVYASVRQPFGDLMVRAQHERRSINVIVVADVSASMGFNGTRRKLDVVADFSHAAADSAHRLGDAFGFFGVEADVRADLCMPPSRSRGVGEMVAGRLRDHKPRGRSVTGLAAAAARIGRQRALVFVLSDFHFPLPDLDLALSAWSRHWVVPVVVWDRREYELPGAWGLSAIRDLESGQTRLLFLRPGLRAKIRGAVAQRWATLRECCARHGVEPLMLRDGFDAERVTRYFCDPHGLSESVV